jgi:hypothetical protein
MTSARFPGSILAVATLAGCGNGSHDSSKASESPADSAFTDAQLKAQSCSLDSTPAVYVAGADASSTAAGAGGVGTVIPCFQLTGQGAAETSLVVTKDGTVLYAPTFEGDQVGLLRTRDHGVTWDFSVPAFPDGKGHGRPQPYMYRDSATDRVFFSTAATGGHDLTYSDDAGKTWSYVKVANDSIDWLKIYAGPPVSSTTEGYPNIVYLSAPSPTSTPIGTLLPDHQTMYKSLDGGATYTSITPISLKTSDVPGCDPTEWVIAGNGTVAEDGTIYQSFRRCTHLGVAVSTDEGQTWTMREVTGSSLPPADVSSLGMLVQIIDNPNWLLTEALTVDETGTLYALWPDAASTLRYSFSKDRAATWSPALVVQAPGVTKSVYGSISVKSPGHIAVSYHGSVDGTAFNGYVAESANALEAAPEFTSYVVNDPADPLFANGFDSGYAGTFSGGDLNEIINVKYAPDGDIWASFVKDMCPGIDTSTDNCTWDIMAHAKSTYQGAVARLVHR